MTRFLLARLGWILAGAILLTGLSEHALGLTCTQTASVTLTGNLRSANGLPLSNGVMTLVPTQQGFIAGCGVNLATPNFCGTSTDGSVVGIQNPLISTINTSGGLGTLPAATYYSVYEWYDAAGNVTLPSPESVLTVSMTSELTVNQPSSGIPAGAVGMKVFISTSSGTETLQGQTTGSASFVQSVPLVTGSALASSNTTVCQVVANDAVWPTGTGYNVSLTDKNGNSIPGYPMSWQLIGPGTTYNLSNGLPYYHGVVYYPVPILSQPANHGQQSISGPLNFGGYNVSGIGRLGVGTNTPGFGVDVEGAGINGVVNAKVGYLFNGSAGTLGQALCSDGTYLDQFCTFVTSLPTFYYQTVQANAVDQTQRAKLNFSSKFDVTDSASPSRTTVDLHPIGAGGTCTFPSSVVYDTLGRITSCTNGVTSSILASVSFTSCTLGDDGTGGSGCQTTQSWGTTIGGTYTMWCTVGYVAGIACGNLGDCSGVIYNEESHTSTDFTYILNQRLANGRTHSVPMTCWATN